MYLVDYKELKSKMIGAKIPKPLSGTLSGHSAGEPFDKHVYKLIQSIFPQETFRQFEYLNFLYTKHNDKVGFEARQKLFNSPTVMFLLSRGKNATDKWSIDNPFEEKQNDTADILVVKENFFEIIDIKTRKLSKNAQAPNIISAYKLAQVCAKMIDNDEFDNFAINYFEIEWLLEDDYLVCQDAHYANLFQSNPTSLYINWAAAMQIQFHVSNLEQNFDGTMHQWAKSYLQHFVSQAKKRADDMINKFVIPFEKYL
ncbi:MAG: HincII family type II restriction endonuclease [Campylobacterales bacterium]|nr:HincII family type II restriction endonuclease [Campylobacterales bacterium]